MRITKSVAGFTLLELIMAITLFSLFAFIGIGAYFQYYTTSIRNVDIENVYNQLHYSRFRSMKNATDSEYGIYLDDENHKIISFRETYIPDNPENVEQKLARLEIYEININPSPGVSREILFERRTGRTSNYGTFNIGRGEFTHTITINEQGVID